MNKKDYINIQKTISGMLGKDAAIEFIHGVLTAILCAPEMIPPSVWLPLLLHKEGEEIEFESMDTANSLIGTLMILYNEISRCIAEDDFFPLYSHRNAPGKSQLRTDSGTAQVWCRGFVGGLGVWSTDIARDEKARELLMPVFLLVDNAILLEENPDIPSETVNLLIKNSVSAVADSVVMLREYYLEKSKIRNSRVGRNEPCPCGSGKKFKKCCGIA